MRGLVSSGVFLALLISCSEKPSLQADLEIPFGLGPEARVLLDTGEVVGEILEFHHARRPPRAELSIADVPGLDLRANACAKPGPAATLVLVRGDAEEPFTGEVVPGCDLGLRDVADSFERLFETLDGAPINPELTDELDDNARSVGIVVNRESMKPR
ncbi:MAG: hypothetical protein AAGE52_19585 [Myxococcota bacterium]